MQKIQHLCDVCHLEDGAENPATSLATQFSIGTNVMLADLCERHTNYLFEVMDIYFRAGRRPDSVVTPKIKPKGKGGSKPTPEGDFPCPVTGCSRTFTSEQGVSMHKTRVHAIPGIAKHGQDAHDAAILAASVDDKAPATPGNTRSLKVVSTPETPEDRLEAKRARDRARKARMREQLRSVGTQPKEK
jgi:hypothetical protein